MPLNSLRRSLRHPKSLVSRIRFPLCPSLPRSRKRTTSTAQNGTVEKMGEQQLRLVTCQGPLPRTGITVAQITRVFPAAVTVRDIFYLGSSLLQPLMARKSATFAKGPCNSTCSVLGIQGLTISSLRGLCSCQNGTRTFLGSLNPCTRTGEMIPSRVYGPQILLGFFHVV